MCLKLNEEGKDYNP